LLFDKQLPFFSRLLAKVTEKYLKPQMNTDEEQKIFPLLNKRSFHLWGYCAFFLKYCGVHIKKYKILVA